MEAIGLKGESTSKAFFGKHRKQYLEIFNNKINDAESTKSIFYP